MKEKKIYQTKQVTAPTKMINVSSRLIISNIGNTRYKKSKNKMPKVRSVHRRVIIHKKVEIIKEEVLVKKEYQSR